MIAHDLVAFALITGSPRYSGLTVMTTLSEGWRR